MSQLSQSDGEQSAGEHLERVELMGLVVRMLDDLVQIGEAQAKLFEANIGTVLSAAVDRAIWRALATVMYLLGGLFVLGAIIILLRKRLIWWESLMLAGVLIILVAAVIQWVNAKIQWVNAKLAAHQASQPARDRQGSSPA